VENFELGDLQDLAKYAPVRVFLSGLWRTIFGLFVATIPAVIIWIGLHSDDAAPRTAGDLPPWGLFLVGAVLSLIALGILTGGIGRIISAFSGNCYFRAGRDGIEFRFPKQGWFGRFHVNLYRFKWSEIDQIVHFTYRINLIPVSTALHIYPVGGKKIEVERMYFRKSSKELQKDLLTLQSESWK
jgi:hypothetical protein